LDNSGPVFVDQPEEVAAVAGLRADLTDGVVGTCNVGRVSLD
jgi:hypothetical protein